MRLLSGLLAGRPFQTTLIGDASLSRRPMRRVIDPLTAMGARIDSHDGRAPLTIDGGGFIAIDLDAAGRERPGQERHPAGRARGRRHDDASTSRWRHAIIRSAPFRRSALPASRSTALPCRRRGRPAGHGARRTRSRVPGDPSSAAVWAAAAAALPGSSRASWRRLPQSTAARLRPRARADGRRIVDRAVQTRSPASRSAPFAVGHDGSHGPRVHRGRPRCPSLIDELPVLAARAALGGVARGLRRRRAARQGERPHHALVTGFAALGVDAEERPDGFVIDGSRAPTGGARPTPPATIGSSWRSRSSASAPPARPRSPAPTPSRCPIRTSRATWRALSRDHRQDLSRRLHGQRQEHDRARAGGAPALARRGHRRSHRSARAADDRRDLRAAGRAVLPRRSSARSCSCSQPIRHVVVATGGGTFADPDNRAAINLDGVSVWIDVPLGRSDPAHSARRPAAARGRRAPSSSGCTPRASTPTGSRTSASPRRAAGVRDRRSHSRRAPPAAVPSAAQRIREVRALSRSSATSTPTCRRSRRCSPTPGRSATTRCCASAISSATAPIRAPSIDRTLALAAGGDRSAAITTRCAPGSSPRTLFNDVARQSIEWTRERPARRRSCKALADLPQGPATQSTDRHRDLPRRAVRRGLLRLRRRATRRARIDAARRAICLFGHTHLPAVFATSDDPVARREDLQDDDAHRCPPPGRALINVGSVGQPRDGDPRAAYGLLDLERGVAVACAASPTTSPARRRRILDAGLPPWLALRLERGQ